MLRIVIVGATSAIAEHTARCYAARGARLFLVGRQAQRLADIVEDLRIRGAKDATFAVLDVNQLAEHADVLAQAWSWLGEVDAMLIAHGTLPNQSDCEQSPELAVAEFNINATATIALMTLAATKLEAQRHGTLAVISSVAGDRGRQSNYLYGAAKAAVSTFASGLRQRLTKVGVNIVTIKPGFVDTPMTREFRKGALWAKPETVARGIMRAIDRRRSVVYLPWFWSMIMLIIKLIPEFLFKRIKF